MQLIWLKCKIYLVLWFVSVIITYQLKQKQKQMTTLTITVNGKRTGEQIFFILNVAKSNFLNVVDMTWETVEDVLRGEKEGHYIIAK